MKKLVTLLFAFASAVAAAVPAYAAGVVEKLQMPAWVERGTNRIPLKAGIDVHAQDTLETGTGGRLHVLFADGSVLELGEKSRLVVLALPPAGEPAEISLQLASGSLRLLTKAATPDIPPTLTLHMPSMKAQMGQADVCAQASAQVDTLCLVNGTVSVQPVGGATVMMDQPDTVLRVSRSGAPTPVSTADPEVLKGWLTTTELPVGDGMIIPGGGWAVQFMATRAERTARSFKQKLEHAGYAAELTTSETNGKALYRLRITQLDSKAEAAGLAARMTAELKIAQPWVTTARIPGG